MALQLPEDQDVVDGDESALRRLLELLLGCAVQGDRKDDHVFAIMNMDDEATKQHLVAAIQAVMRLNTSAAPTPRGVDGATELHEQLQQLQTEHWHLQEQHQQLQARLEEVGRSDDADSAGELIRLRRQLNDVEDSYEMERAELLVELEGKTKELIQLSRQLDGAAGQARQFAAMADELEEYKLKAQQVPSLERKLQLFEAKTESLQDRISQMEAEQQRTQHHDQRRMELEGEAVLRRTLESRLAVAEHKVHQLQAEQKASQQRTDAVTRDLQQAHNENQWLRSKLEEVKQQDGSYDDEWAARGENLGAALSSARQTDVAEAGQCSAGLGGVEATECIIDLQAPDTSTVSTVSTAVTTVPKDRPASHTPEEVAALRNQIEALEHQNAALVAQLPDMTGEAEAETTVPTVPTDASVDKEQTAAQTKKQPSDHNTQASESEQSAVLRQLVLAEAEIKVLEARCTALEAELAKTRRDSSLHITEQTERDTQLLHEKCDQVDRLSVQLDEAQTALQAKEEALAQAQQQIDKLTAQARVQRKFSFSRNGADVDPTVDGNADATDTADVDADKGSPTPTKVAPPRPAAPTRPASSHNPPGQLGPERVAALEQLRAKLVARANTSSNLKRIRQCEDLWLPPSQPLNKHGRVYVQDGFLDKLCRKALKRRRVFLFSDILVYGTPAVGKKCRQQHVLPWAEVSIEHVPGFDNALQINHRLKSFQLFAADPREKTEWFDQMREYIEMCSGRSAVGQVVEASVILIPDWQARACMVCQKTSFGLVNRRHHCRKCGKVVCEACSKHRAKIKGKLKRVCTPCFSQQSTEVALRKHTPQPRASVMTARLSRLAREDGSSSEESDEVGDEGEESDSHAEQLHRSKSMSVRHGTTNGAATPEEPALPQRRATAALGDGHTAAPASAGHPRRRRRTFAKKKPAKEGAQPLPTSAEPATPGPAASTAPTVPTVPAVVPASPATPTVPAVPTARPRTTSQASRPKRPDVPPLAD